MNKTTLLALADPSVRYKPGTKERSRNAELLRNYGITIDDYDVMLTAQRGVCRNMKRRCMGEQKIETECPISPNGKHVWVVFDKTKGCAECGTKRFETEAD